MRSRATIYCFLALHLFISFNIARVSPLSFKLNFTESSHNGLDTIQFQEDAFYNKAVRLTKEELNGQISHSVGRAVYTDPMTLWDSTTGELADFTTRFTFKIIARISDGSYGEGLAFFLSSYPSVIPNNSNDGYLGLFSNSTDQSEPSNQIVAVEFDSHKNSWDPDDNHVGINIHSIISATNVTWNSSINDGRIANAWVTYQASSRNLSVFLTYKDNPTFSGDSALSYSVDLRKYLPDKVAIGFSAATGKLVEAHQILYWEFSSTDVQLKSKKMKSVLVISLSTGVSVMVCCMGLVWCFLSFRKTRRSRKEEEEKLEYDESIDDEFEKGRGPRRFRYNELVAATKNFAFERKLGEGGFGAVYQGFLKDQNLNIAIKRVAKGSTQGRKEYVSEVKIISRLRHRNLVQLVGWCHEHGEFLLVYEFMPNRSLDTHLYDNSNLLTWPLRFKITIGIASALLYLHEEWEQCVVHRDVKPSNVMLDSAFNAKLGDFGLARLVDHDRGSQTTVLAGTMGYLAPECVTTGKASKESDVYSFGILALEIACGRRPVVLKEDDDKIKLVQWVWDLYGRNEILNAVDGRLDGAFDEREAVCLMVVGLWCAHPDYNFRPSIRQVISVLKFEMPLPSLPPKMPVAMYFAPPIHLCRFSYTSSDGTLKEQERSNGYGKTSSSSATNASSLPPSIHLPQMGY
ncbi:L-type lectin-domain containing receptor kinase IX.1-like [Phragmites australis]|uniref:L-type lectin-domain containing receptor kinase IX.1-like n=1 Tax=Phragmites australis TaxID=29695 RepID=UPI002D794F91|nr:L-type lectin-domain containing receptor kinase IX.1-like [Phragmites australis]